MSKTFVAIYQTYQITINNILGTVNQTSWRASFIP